MRVSRGLLCHIAAVSVLLYACSSGQSDITGRNTDPAPTAGASSTPPGNEACAATADSIQANVFKASCDGAGCHGAQNPAASLNLVDAPLDRLMTTSSALCSGWSLVVPGSPEKSLLYQKLSSDAPPCGASMPLGQHLSAASTKCIADWITGMASAGGCEKCGGSECVALASDANHCGACDKACPAGVACENGACSCPNGTQACGGSCVDVSSDERNCGACGKVCSPGSACENGNCACPASLASCGGLCAELSSDPQNCGACGTACGAQQVCAAGKCANGCGGLTQCGARCVDTQTSPLSCGGCDNACPAGLTCAAGKCSCPSGELCGGSCVDTGSDAANCGKCGAVCGAGEACVSGACQCNASGAVSFKNVVAPLLEGACTAAGCHAGAKPKEDLDLGASKAYSELVNVATSQCGGQRKLVLPGSPSQSYLLQKLLNVDVCTGTQMPKAGQTLPRAQLDQISAWICSGAPNN